MSSGGSRDRSGSGSQRPDTVTATERTALLSSSPNGHQSENRTAKKDDGSGAHLDPNQRASSPDPEAGLDHAAGGTSTPTTPTTLKQREYLIDTNPRQFWAAFICVTSSFFVACFDTTIMASSHPVITSYFHSSNSASWLSTAFLLTSTAVQPIVGRLSDTLGRKRPYLMTTVIFTAATTWCAMAQSLASFVVARAVCGLGAGGMIALASIIVSDLVPIERRGIYQSFTAMAFGVAMTSGAALGGLMADTLGWRWEFGVQVPPLVFCLVLAAVQLPADLGLYVDRETFVVAMKAFDWAGSLLLTSSITFLILGLNLGGNILPWSHPLIIATLVLFGLGAPAFVYAENRANRPIMPLLLLRKPPRANLIFANFIAAFLMNAILFNVPLFFQAVLLTSATTSGLYLVVPNIVSTVLGISTGFLLTWTRRLKWPVQLGTLFFLGGTVVLCTMQRGWPTWLYLLCLVPSSAAQGLQFPGTFMAVLATSGQAEQAVVTSTLLLWRAMGSVLGIACSSLVVQNALRVYLAAKVRLDEASGHDAAWKEELVRTVRGSVEAVAGLRGEVREQVVESYEAAVKLAFGCCVGVALVSVLLILPIRLPRLGARKQ